MRVHFTWILKKWGIPYEGAFHLDFEKMGDAATGLLVKKRHASIACVAGDDSLAREFFQGYRKRLFDEKLPFRQELVFPDGGSLYSSARRKP